jgi:single-stranded DNA-binding protein
VTVGSARYISGPSWRLPDGPIVGLNFKGNVSVFQGNGNGEMISSGTSLEDWLPSPIIALKAGTSDQFDSCGSWLMRALTGTSGKVLGFYHAETACTYANNGQTRKAAGFAESVDGGKTFTKPGYPNNKVTDTSTPLALGKPSGEGDISVVGRGDYYYMFIGNVEDWHTGVARAAKSGDGYPGSWYKYFEGAWNERALGGQSSRLKNVAGTQVYLHTPSQSFVSVGNSNPYWNNGFMMSASDNAIDWTYLADPIFTPDPVTNLDDIMYPSFLGPTGGYDIGSKFQFYYLWIPPWSDWSNRYQIAKDVTLTYVGENNTMPLTKIALTSYRASDSQETWQTTELCVAPYHPVGIVGYLMSRPYPYSFVVYDCYNYATKDHFVGTADECFLAGSGVEVTRTLGYMWSSRVAKSIAVYRCTTSAKDIFLSANANCDGLAPTATTPFGYVMDGPAFVLSQDILIPQGASWKFSSTQPAAAWTQLTFNDEAWPISASPFGQSYSTAKSFFGGTSFYFRYNFQVAAGKNVKSLLLSVSSDDFSTVYLNGVQVDSDSVTWHEASYWNRRVYIDTSALIIGGNNVLAVKTQNYDNWAYFDLMLVANYDTSSNSKRSVAEETDVLVQKETETARVTRSVPQYDQTLAKRAETDGFRTLLDKGSNWKYLKSGVPADTWTQKTFDDSKWLTGAAPFVTGYSAYEGKGTPFGNNNYYFRSKFTIPSGQIVTGVQLNVASDNYAYVYINGYLVDKDTSDWHQAKYWNREVTIAPSMISSGDNVIAVVTYNMDQWAFFDLQINVQYAESAVPPPTLIPQGSIWVYYNAKTDPATSWNQQNFDDSKWSSAVAPFVTGYQAYVGKTPFGPTNHYFRSKFTIPSGTVATTMTISVASDNAAVVYLNGFEVYRDQESWHQATYWNSQIRVDTKYLVAGSNTIAVLVKNEDAWAFFDCQVSATYASGTIAPTPKPSVAPTVAPTVAPAAPTTGPGVSTTLITKGSNWAYVKSQPSTNWNQLSFDDSTWTVGAAPFVTGYNAYVGKGTPFGNTNHYFRSKFTIPNDQTVQSLRFSIASDNYALVYVNGQLVDKDDVTWHEAKYWNRQIDIDTTFVNHGVNVIAVVVMNSDAWAFFDLQLDVVYSSGQVAPDGMLVAKGSAWKFYNQTTAPSGTWITSSFNDASWTSSKAPFVTGYNAYKGQGTPFGNTAHYFRSTFTVTSASAISSVMLSVASDNYAIVYINGVMVDKDDVNWHEATYWNRQKNIDKSVIVSGVNTIAAVTYNLDQWAFFDLQLVATYASGNPSTPTVTPTPSPTPVPGGGGGSGGSVECGIKGQIIGGVCKCDAGWGGLDCSVNLCTYTGTQTETVIPAGSAWRNAAWPNTGTSPAGWFGINFDDSWWQINPAPFGTTGYAGVATSLGKQATRRLYRKKFLINVPYGMTVQNATLSIMSEDVHRVWLNGKFIDSPVYPYAPHSAKKWNTVLKVKGSMFNDVGQNVISVEVPLVDGRWSSYFDMQLTTQYGVRTCTTLI